MRVGIFVVGRVCLNQSISKKEQKQLLLELAQTTETTWRRDKTISKTYSTKEFSIISNLKGGVLYHLLDEYKQLLVFSSIKIYKLDVPEEYVELVKGKLKYLKKGEEYES